MTRWWKWGKPPEVKIKNFTLITIRTDMSMTMNGLTRSQFDEMGQQLDEMANKIGNTIESVHDIGKILPNLYGNI